MIHRVLGVFALILIFFLSSVAAEPYWDTPGSGYDSFPEYDPYPIATFTPVPSPTQHPPDVSCIGPLGGGPWPCVRDSDCCRFDSQTQVPLRCRLHPTLSEHGTCVPTCAARGGRCGADLDCCETTPEGSPLTCKEVPTDSQARVKICVEPTAACAGEDAPCDSMSCCNETAEGKPLVCNTDYVGVSTCRVDCEPLFYRCDPANPDERPCCTPGGSQPGLQRVECSLGEHQPSFSCNPVCEENMRYNIDSNRCECITGARWVEELGYCECPTGATRLENTNSPMCLCPLGTRLDLTTFECLDQVTPSPTPSPVSTIPIYGPESYPTIAPTPTWEMETPMPTMTSYPTSWPTFSETQPW